MSFRSPQDIYARRLLSSRGYPLWIPEPDRELLEYERTDGLEIGDVGVVNPEDGCFDVLFNICLPANHTFHRTFGVPEGFAPVELSKGDIRITANIVTPGSITSTSVKNVDRSRMQSGSCVLDYEFNLFPREGALLILPEGADRHVLRNESCFLDYAIQHGADWYRFARERRGWIINRDALYLITGFHKARSWSLAAYENATASDGLSAMFRATQVGGDDIDIGTAYTWRTAHPSDRRIGPVVNYGLLNQAVFIRGFKIALRDGFPGMQRVMVKAGAPSARPMHTRLSGLVPRNNWVASFWRRKTNARTSGAGGEGRGTSNPAPTHGSSTILPDEEMLAASVEIRRLPEVSPVFHPCDVINEYLLQQHPSAEIAISHDSNWVTLLEKRLLTPDELAQEKHLRNVVSRACHPISREGVVYLENTSDSSASDFHSPANNVDRPISPLSASRDRPVSSNDPAAQNSIISTLYVSFINISLARDSRKTIRSVTLRKNGELLKSVQKTICAGGVHQEEFDPPLSVEKNDHISISVSCNSRMRQQMDIPIDINLRDIQCMRDEQGIRSYRKKERNVEVMVVGYQSLLATTAPIGRSCSRFRLLVIGNVIVKLLQTESISPRFKSGVGKSSLIRRVFGVDDVYTSETSCGMADIDQELISPTNDRFVVHDSPGFEAGDERNVDIVRDFIARRAAMSQVKDQLHAIWFCLEIFDRDGDLLEADVEKFLQRRNEVLRNVPFVVVLTKVDLLDTLLELDPPEGETLEQFKSRCLNEYCIRPLHEAAGNDIMHVTVSVKSGYSESLCNLIKATMESMAKYHEATRSIASIAQRVSIKEKIELSIAVWKKKYWRVILQSAVLRGHTLWEYLQTIRRDIVTVWNLNDPDRCLMDDNITAAILLTDDLEHSSDGTDILTASLELVRAIAPGDVAMSFAGPVAGAAISALQITYGTYQEAKKNVKVSMAYTVDLICVLQAIFLVAWGSRVTPQTVALALRAYETPRKFVHLMVDAFDGKLGVLPGGREHVLEKIEALVWRHSIRDHEIEGLRRRIN